MTTTQTQQDTPVVELKEVTKRYGGITAVNGVSLAVPPRSVVALVGDNGAGKSTISKIIAGAEHPDAGEVLVGGETRASIDPTDVRKSGIEVVYQDLALAPNLDVATNLFLGRERVKAFGWLDRASMRKEAKELLGQLDVYVPSLTTKVERLSGGQRQAIAIARATHWAKSLVVMDEPTAALGLRETAKVEELILTLREQGKSVLVVSHNLEQVFRLSDQILVMRRGNLVADFQTQQTTTDTVVKTITGVI